MSTNLSPGQKAARTRKRKATAAKAWVTRKRRAAGKKAAETRRANKQAVGEGA
jgi:hypothetical protein